MRGGGTSGTPGSTRRRGGELGLASSLGATTIGVSYSYSDFAFRDYVVGTSDFSGNRIPGVPNQQLQGYATYNWRGWFATVEGQTAGGMFMDDANTLRASGWEVLNARVGGRVTIGGRVVRAGVRGVEPVRSRVCGVDRRECGGGSLLRAVARAYDLCGFDSRCWPLVVGSDPTGYFFFSSTLPLPELIVIRRPPAPIVARRGAGPCARGS